MSIFENQIIDMMQTNNEGGFVDFLDADTENLSITEEKVMRIKLHRTDMHNPENIFKAAIKNGGEKVAKEIADKMKTKGWRLLNSAEFNKLIDAQGWRMAFFTDTIGQDYQVDSYYRGVKYATEIHQMHKKDVNGAMWLLEHLPGDSSTKVFQRKKRGNFAGLYLGFANDEKKILKCKRFARYGFFFKDYDTFESAILETSIESLDALMEDLTLEQDTGIKELIEKVHNTSK